MVGVLPLAGLKYLTDHSKIFHLQKKNLISSILWPTRVIPAVKAVKQAINRLFLRLRISPIDLCIGMIYSVGRNTGRMVQRFFTIFDAIKQKRPNTKPNPTPKTGPMMSIWILGCLGKNMCSLIDAICGWLAIYVS